MKGIRQAVTCLCFVTTLSTSLQCLAAPGEASQAAEPASSPIVQSASKLDLSQLRRMPVWSAQSTASAETPMPVKAQTQASGGERSHLSAAKKTWIIIGSVLGAAVVVAAVSNSGGGGGGGGY